MSSILWLHVARILQNFLIYDLLYLSGYHELISFLEIGIIFVGDRYREHSTANLQCFGLEIVFKELNIHGS